jgi:solute carrier family 25 phosphate transporter 23/24/25/41
VVLVLVLVVQTREIIHHSSLVLYTHTHARKKEDKKVCRRFIKKRGFFGRSGWKWKCGVFKATDDGRECSTDGTGAGAGAGAGTMLGRRRRSSASGVEMTAFTITPQGRGGRNATVTRSAVLSVTMRGTLRAKRGKKRTTTPNAIAEISKAANAAGKEARMTLKRLVVDRENPTAALTHLVAPGLAMFLAGGCAGALAKTCTAPLDRLKIIMQTAGASRASAASVAAADKGLLAAFVAIGKTEGLAGYWRGNVPQVVRILPYSSAMLYSYETYKKKLTNKETGELSVPGRLLAGAGAACTATIVTYPLDIIRLRLSVDTSANTMRDVVRNILANEGPAGFFKGLRATCVSIAPYSALNFCAFDLFKKALPEEIRNEAQGIATASLMATALATGSMYPLDTIRRQMQLQGSTYANIIDAGRGIVAANGVGGLFRGFIPNAMKNMPNKSIQLTTFDVLKKTIKRSEEEYKKELAILAAENKRRK